MIEEWRLIDNNFYISNLGNIKTLDNTYIDLSNRKSRYLKQKEAIQLWWKKRKEGDVI